MVTHGEGKCKLHASRSQYRKNTSWNSNPKGVFGYHGFALHMCGMADGPIGPPNIHKKNMQVRLFPKRVIAFPRHDH